MKNLKSNLLPIEGHRFQLLKDKFLQRKALTSEMGEIGDLFNQFFYVTAVASTKDKQLVDSCKPYVRIHRWMGGCFRIVVSCYSHEVAEWTTNEITTAATERRLKKKSGKKLKVPWVEIMHGLQWYGELDYTTKYWRILEDDILRSDLDQFTSLAKDERSRRINRRFNENGR